MLAISGGRVPVMKLTFMLSLSSCVSFDHCLLRLPIATKSAVGSLLTAELGERHDTSESHYKGTIMELISKCLSLKGL